ncbi:hypothetical protein KY321_04410 [Candidatus Woesearchaeota archaeon]|nr:hypothetical protein [Candidatus Woesearchaeota archaeon]
MKLVKESLNESMAYKDFFGKEISHEQALQKRIKDSISDVIMEERGISEKAFSDLDSVRNEVEKICSEKPEIYEKAEEYYQSGKRLAWLAEEIYYNYFKK